MKNKEAIAIINSVKFILDNEQYSDDVENAFNMAIKSLEEQERKKGRWIKISRSWLHDDVQCSECRNMLDMNGVNAGRGDANFCPNCGADMRGESE